MTNFVGRAMCFGLLILCVTASAQQQAGEPKSAALADLKWLAGAWAGDDRGNQTEEHWIEPKGGMMLGVNRSVFRNGKSSFEFLRIAETPDGVTYFASPRGGATTAFKLKESSENRVTFENMKHDFPQRVIYRKEKDSLIARIEGTINGKEQSMEWTWQPAAATR